jgi:hypothetical protein
VARAIEEARQARAEEDTWPKVHYLWPQHPILDWLSDRVLTAFGRHRAPVIQCSQLGETEQAVLLMGLSPNRKGQPLLVEWRAAIWNGASWNLEELAVFLERTGLKAGTLSNRAQSMDTSALQARLPQAVAAMRSHMVHRQESFSASMTQRLAGTLAELERLQERQFEQLELRLAANQQAEQFMAMGFKLGFGGALTFERALQLRRLATELPLNALVLETDAPDMAPPQDRNPHPISGSDLKTHNHPANIVTAYEALAALRGISIESLTALTAENFTRLFGAT